MKKHARSGLTPNVITHNPDQALEQVRGGIASGGVTHEDSWDGPRATRDGIATANNGGANGTDHWI